MHQPWLDRPWEFVAYLNQLNGGDNPALWLDRIDNDGHYEPGNLQFVPPEVSALNRNENIHPAHPHEPMVVPRSFKWKRPKPKEPKVQKRYVDKHPDEMRLVLENIDKLPKREQDVARMVFVERLSLGNIATSIKVSVARVRQIRDRAIRRVAAIAAAA